MHIMNNKKKSLFHFNENLTINQIMYVKEVFNQPVYLGAKFKFKEYLITHWTKNKNGVWELDKNG